MNLLVTDKRDIIKASSAHNIEQASREIGRSALFI